VLDEIASNIELIQLPDPTTSFRILGRFPDHPVTMRSLTLWAAKGNCCCLVGFER